MFLDEIANQLNLNGATKNSYLILNISGKGVYVQGAIKITLCSTVKMSFKIGKINYSILGENLTLHNLTNDTILIKGKIYAFLDESKNIIKN